MIDEIGFPVHLLHIVRIGACDGRGYHHGALNGAWKKVIFDIWDLIRVARSCCTAGENYMSMSCPV